MFLLSVLLIVLLLIIAIIVGFPNNNFKLFPKKHFSNFVENNQSNFYPTSNNILDLVLSKIKTAKNDELILLLDIIQKYANNQINRIDLYISNINFSKDCDCFNYFVQQMLNHHFTSYTINKVFQTIRNELNKRSGSCEASGTKLGEADSSVAND